MTYTLVNPDSYPADNRDWDCASLAEFRRALLNVTDALNEPYGWGWAEEGDYEIEGVGKVFDVYIWLPRKNYSLTVSVRVAPEQEAELITLLQETVIVRIKQIWGQLL